MSTHYPVIVIGGGQAGLAISYCLTEKRIEHLVLEQHRVGHTWREQRWDSFCLVTPNWQCKLPGYGYQGEDPKGFMKREEIVAYVEGYACSFGAPVKEGVRVDALERPSPSSPFVLETWQGQLLADQVVVATGSYHRPNIPQSGALLPRHIAQIHSSEYRNAGSLPEGAVLVVGTGQSGCQIAEDLHFAGRTVHLSVGSAPRCARRYRGRDVVEWLDLMGYYDIPIEEHPNKEQVRDKTNHYVTGRDGGRDIDLRKLALEGVKLYGPLSSLAADTCQFAPELRKNLDAADAVYRSINRTIDGFIEQRCIEAPSESEYVPVWEPTLEPESLDLGVEGVRGIVWCTGFRANFGWIRLPAFDDSGYPRHDRGVSAVAGLYFVGLPWLYTWGSGRFSGVGRDARHLSERIQALTVSAGSSRPSESAWAPALGSPSVTTS